jgi:hypothetical protein
MRIFGFNWTYQAVQYALRSGNSSFYFHPWEMGARPKPLGHRLRNQIFLRHTGRWMSAAIQKIVDRFETRIVPARASAEWLLAQEAIAAGPAYLDTIIPRGAAELSVD